MWPIIINDRLGLVDFQVTQMDFFFLIRVFPYFGLFDSSIFPFLPPRKEKKLQNMFIMVYNSSWCAFSSFQNQTWHFFFLGASLDFYFLMNGERENGIFFWKGTGNTWILSETFFFFFFKYCLQLDILIASLLLQLPNPSASIGMSHNSSCSIHHS